MKPALLAALLTMIPILGYAQVAGLSHIDGSGTVTTSSAVCVPGLGGTTLAGTTRPQTCGDLAVTNSGTNTVWFTPTGGTASASGAGSMQLVTGQTAYWPPGACPKQAMQCIAVGGSSAFTVTFGVP